MNLNKIFEKISKKIAEVDKQEADILRKMEANKSEKRRGEDMKSAALNAKDEAGYKNASRIISDAEAGIEFNTICLDELHKEKFASETEDAEIKSGLRHELNEIYCETITVIEKAYRDIENITEDALQKISKLDSVADTWNKKIMKSGDSSTGFDSRNKQLILVQRNNGAKAELNGINIMKKNDPLFKDAK